jgi:hypothetical protein
MKRCRSCGTVWDSKKKDCPECGGVNVDSKYIRSPLEDQFRAEVQQCLKPITAKMTKELRKISKKSLDEETYLLDFAVNSHGYPGYENFDFNFLLRWDAMDEVISQLDDGGDLLGGAGVAIPKESYWAPAYQEFDQNDAAFRVLVQWFADCWEQAGGHKCSGGVRLSRGQTFSGWPKHNNATAAFTCRIARFSRLLSEKGRPAASVLSISPVNIVATSGLACELASESLAATGKITPNCFSSASISSSARICGLSAA